MLRLLHLILRAERVVAVVVVSDHVLVFAVAVVDMW